MSYAEVNLLHTSGFNLRVNFWSLRKWDQENLNLY